MKILQLTTVLTAQALLLASAEEKKPLKPTVKPEPPVPGVGGDCPCRELEIFGLKEKMEKYNGMYMEEQSAEGKTVYYKMMSKEEKKKYNYDMGMFVNAKGLWVIGDVNEKDGEVRFESEQAAAVRCPRDLVNREGQGWKAANEIQRGIQLMCISKCPMCKEVFDGPTNRPPVLKPEGSKPEGTKPEGSVN